MKKYIFLLILLLLPLTVFAKDSCDPSNIEIESINLENSIGNIEELSEFFQDDSDNITLLRINFEINERIC